MTVTPAGPPREGGSGAARERDHVSGEPDRRQLTCRRLSTLLVTGTRGGYVGAVVA